MPTSPRYDSRRSPFRSRPARLLRIVIPLVIAGIYLAARSYLGGDPSPTRFDTQPVPAGSYQVERVVDGDTLIVLIDDPSSSEPRRERLRLLGIDSPETVKQDTPVEPWGPEASEFTKQFVADGNVRLEFDKRRVDQYGRLLAYVYVGEQMLNEALVAEGLARASGFPGDSGSIARRLRKAEEAAQAERKGIWSEE